jgi:hypothetical protein
MAQRIAEADILASMKDKPARTQRRTLPGPVIALVLVVVLSLAYPLSYGPVLAIQYRGYVSPETVMRIYWPVNWAYQRYRPAKWALDRYLDVIADLGLIPEAARSSNPQ